MKTMTCLSPCASANDVMETRKRRQATVQVDLEAPVMFERQVKIAKARVSRPDAREKASMLLSGRPASPLRAIVAL